MLKAAFVKIKREKEKGEKKKRNREEICRIRLWLRSGTIFNLPKNCFRNIIIIFMAILMKKERNQI